MTTLDFWGYSLFMESFEFEQQVLFRVVTYSVTSYRWVHCPRVGLAVNLSLYKNSKSISQGYTCLSGFFF